MTPEVIYANEDGTWRDEPQNGSVIYIRGDTADSLREQLSDQEDKIDQILKLLEKDSTLT